VSEREYNRKTKKYLNIGDDKIKWYSINENIEEVSDMVYSLSNSVYSNLKALVTFDEENQMATTLTILDKQTDRIIQTIELAENQIAENGVLYATDVNFDGEQDIVIPQSSSASALYLSAYIWNSETMQYIYAPTFENLSNVALDTNRKLILSSRSSDRTVSYAISVYDKSAEDFVVQKWLTYYPDDAEENMIYKEKQLKNGRLQIVKEFIKPFTNYYTMDPEVANYYENHSEWQLNSSIWENYLVIQENESSYETYELTDEEFQTVKNQKIFKELGLSMAFPLNWKCLKTSGEDGSYYYFEDFNLEETKIILSVTGKEYAKEYTKNVYSQILSVSGYKDAKISSYTKEKIGGYNCTRAVASYMDDNTKFTQIHYYNIVAGDRLYDLRITYPSNKNAEYEDIFESIINSVVFATDDSVVKKNAKHGSNIYTDDEIESAIKVIKSDFEKDWKGCTLKKIAYLGDERLESYREFADRNNCTDVLVLTSDFYVAPTGAHGSLNADSTYEDYKWILVRNKGEAWKHVDHGYP
ncbi:MAG: hypothetical protein IKJ50_07880, partial [Clostridia bacterium]|nr:hypothetical protein [Clostridia bacterium]